MSGDVRDILDLEQPSTEITKDAVLNSRRKVNYNYDKVKTAKRPEGMHREVFALLYNDNKDAPPLLPTETGSGYKQAKARLGMKNVRRWEWTPFVNPARKDNAAFHHWRRVSDEPKEYPFAKFNKQLNIQQYTANEYNLHLKSNNPKWSKLQTDHLFDLGNRFDLRFVIMADRWDRTNYGTITVEDLKERYYEVVGILTKIRGNSTVSLISATTPTTTTPATTPTLSLPSMTDKKVFVFDAEHERKRKEQLRKLFDRTTKQIEEEQMLINELKKIEARKKERDRKTQDLQKLISQADQQGETPPAATSARKHDKKLNKKRTPNYVRPSRVDSVVNAVESAGIKFNDLRGTGVSLRSQKMKLPANIGQKKAKALEQALIDFKVDPAPPPVEEICNAFNELRSDLVLLCELRTALATCNFELEASKHQYEALCPGKTLNIPACLVTQPEDTKSADNIIDVVGSPNAV